jgi:hypothetical protein
MYCSSPDGDRGESLRSELALELGVHARRREIHDDHAFVHDFLDRRVVLRNEEAGGDLGNAAEGTNELVSAVAPHIEAPSADAEDARELLDDRGGGLHESSPRIRGALDRLDRLFDLAEEVLACFGHGAGDSNPALESPP